VAKKLASSFIINDGTEVPEAPCYVVATDAFMSGWGEAHGRSNIVILPCASQHEAVAVMGFVQRRREMRDVRITNRANLRIDTLRNAYSLFSRATAPAWYPETP
jgi:hypothetical protein